MSRRKLSRVSDPNFEQNQGLRLKVSKESPDFIEVDPEYLKVPHNLYLIDWLNGNTDCALSQINPDSVELFSPEEIF
jgi:hypothetical protein